MSDTATPRILAVGVLVGFFAVLGALIWRGLPAEGAEALLVLLGALGGSFGTVIAFYFGSSAGSDRKTELLAKATPSTAPNVADTEPKS